MHALIDADILAYEFGSCKDESGEWPLSWPFIAARVNPFWYESIRKYLVHFRGAEIITGMEADDKLSIEQWEDLRHCEIDSTSEPITVLCSRDKDLDMVPGWHYSWGAGNQKEKGVWWVDEITGLKSFYKQLLTGDSTDNIPGLFGVGKSSALLKHVDSCSTELEMYRLVKKEYVKRFGSYSEMFLKENSLLLWMLRTENTNEVLERLEDLRVQSFALDLKNELQNN
jgi:hypothetical protein